MKILIVKPSSLGDIIHTFPAISYLDGHYPGCQIDWVVEKPFSDLLCAHPLVQQILIIDTKRWRKQWLSKETWQEIFTFRKQLRESKYDLLFDFQGNIKSSAVTLQAHSRHKVGFGYKAVSEWPNLCTTTHRYTPSPYGNVCNEYLFLAESYCGKKSSYNHAKPLVLKISLAQQEKIESILALPSLAHGHKIMVCPGSYWRNKQLPRDLLASLLAQIQQKINSSFLLLWGSEEERQFAHNLQSQLPGDSSLIIDKLSLSSLQTLMSRVDCVIAMDSLPLHLAATTSTPTFSIFGASSASKYAPQGKQHLALQGSCPYGRTFIRRCPLLRSCKTGLCMQSFSSQELFSHFLDFGRHQGLWS